MKQRTLINLHHGDYLRIADCPNGTYDLYELKMNRKFYRVRVVKNSLSADISIEPKTSKFFVSHRYVTVKTDAVLGKDFFENIDELHRAQSITSRFSRELYRGWF